MNVVEVSPLFFPYIGGVETHVHEVSKRLAKAGVNVRIFTTDPTGELPKKDLVDGIEVFRFRSFTPKRLYYFSPDLYLALRRLRDVDLIHVHGFPEFPSIAGALAKDKNGKPLILTPHYGGYTVHTIGTSTWRTLTKKFYNRWPGKYLFHKHDVVVAVSQFEKEVIKETFGMEETGVKCIPNGITIEKIAPTTRKNRESRNLLYVGRLEKYKGIHFLLKGFSKIEGLPDAQLVIVGRGPYKQDLISLAENLKISKSVKFMGYVSDQELPEIYSSSNVFVTLPQQEVFGIALVEAMAYGLPVIATNVGGIPEIVQTGKTGFLLDFPPDEEKLAETITLLLKDQEYADKMGIMARESVLSRFSWDRVVEDLLNLYNEVSLQR